MVSLVISPPVFSPAGVRKSSTYSLISLSHLRKSPQGYQALFASLCGSPWCVTHLNEEVVSAVWLCGWYMTEMLDSKRDLLRWAENLDEVCRDVPCSSFKFDRCIVHEHECTISLHICLVHQLDLNQKWMWKDFLSFFLSCFLSFLFFTLFLFALVFHSSHCFSDLFPY